LRSMRLARPGQPGESRTGRGVTNAAHGCLDRIEATSTLHAMVDAERTRAAETKLAGFFANYPPPIAKLGKVLRARLRARLPGLNELVYVYERQGSLVLSYSPTEGGADGVCGLGVYPDGVKLFFGQGARLAKTEPGKLLHGQGKTVRHVGIEAVADFERPAIEQLITAAVQLAKLRLDAKAEGAVILKAGAAAVPAGKVAKAAKGGSGANGAKAANGTKAAKGANGAKAANGTKAAKGANGTKAAKANAARPVARQATARRRSKKSDAE